MPKIVDHEARRQELYAVAAALIANGGMEAATIRDIAQASGYSKGVVEHYFENKDELISGALAWVNQQYEQRVEKVTAGFSGLEALRKRMKATLPLDKTVRNEWKVRLVFWSLAGIHPELRKAQEQRFQKALDFFERDIADAIRMGEISSEENSADRARRLLNMTTGISTAALHNLSLYNKTFLLQEIDYLIDRVVNN
ncbi:MAG: TetR/AcrR family transcriptional regulator [Pseudomonadales bacterium]|nr:TetR/AcrR family transcriptional regulator [Pseudomonadales bacterium]